tara:strand:+ start:759 stop:968 length:210 start_codon:yes stop_codon:yes gene_type:complete
LYKKCAYWLFLELFRYLVASFCIVVNTFVGLVFYFGNHNEKYRRMAGIFTTSGVELKGIHLGFCQHIAG